MNQKNLIILVCAVVLVLGFGYMVVSNNDKSDEIIINTNNTNNDKIMKSDEVVNEENVVLESEEKAEVESTETILSSDEDLASIYKYAVLKTNFGDITVELYGEDSPITVNNFLKLSQDKFYDGTKFHRVIKDFMIQGGDPNSKDDDWSNDGTGGPGYAFDDEFNDHKLVKGSLAMANAGPNTNGSQFFIVTAEATPWLDGRHTNFGQVVEGMDVVLKIEAVEKNTRDHPTTDVIIKSIQLVK